MPIVSPTGDGAQARLYTEGMPIGNQYTFMPGVCILPLAEDPPTDATELKTWSPVVKLVLHAPYRIRRVRYATTKDNNPPIIPSPQQDSGSFIFINGSIGISNTMNQSYLNFDWNLACDYVYVENCVSRNQDGLVLGTPPWTWGTTALNEGVFSPAQPSSLLGAVSHAGNEPLIGKTQETVGVTPNLSSGLYLYNVPSYFPGTFFGDDLVNGGTPIQPVP